MEDEYTPSEVDAIKKQEFEKGYIASQNDIRRAQTEREAEEGREAIKYLKKLENYCVRIGLHLPYKPRYSQCSYDEEKPNRAGTLAAIVATAVISLGMGAAIPYAYQALTENNNSHQIQYEKPKLEDIYP